MDHGSTCVHSTQYTAYLWNDVWYRERRLYIIQEGNQSVVSEFKPMLFSSLKMGVWMNTTYFRNEKT